MRAVSERPFSGRQLPLASSLWSEPGIQLPRRKVSNRCVAVIGQGAERSNEGVGGQARSPFLRLRPFLRDWFEAVRRLRTKETPRVVIGL